MENNAMLFSILWEKKVVDDLAHAMEEAGFPQAQLDWFLRSFEWDSANRILFRMDMLLGRDEVR